MNFWKPKPGDKIKILKLTSSESFIHEHSKEEVKRLMQCYDYCPICQLQLEQLYEDIYLYYMKFEILSGRILLQSWN